jgi:hypothetical protein
MPSKDPFMTFFLRTGLGDEHAEQLLQIRWDYYTKQMKAGLEKSLKSF